MAKKFIKQVSAMNGDKVAYWVQTRHDRWDRRDKYGDPVTGPGASNAVMLNWLLDGLVELVDECKFEPPYPRVFKADDVYLIAMSAKERLYRIESNLTLDNDGTMVSDIWIDNYSASHKQIVGEERLRVLKIFEALKGDK